MEAVFSRRKRGRSLIKQPNMGDVVVVRYYDAVVFKDLWEASKIAPVIRETVGWLDYEDSNYIRLIWERHAEAIINEESKTRITGLAIRKSDIIEVRLVA
jgi:hypothetical protein